ncbi:MAG: Sua5/YciO/YrdC/YwlC family protein [Armatimonadetes bacterium]|nr:Sua5/YciO/YrdC/YwlC family protein [Armatimonadota bacterium]
MDIYTEIDRPFVRETLKARLLQGHVVILPTDTIYGISGNALDEKVVRRILEIKGRESPFSIIPHSLDWARLLIADSHRSLFDSHIHGYTGPYTTLWPYSGRLAHLVEPLRSSGLVGLRLPDHWITELASEAGVPLITTSVNVHQRPYMTFLDDLEESIRLGADLIVYEGPLCGPPSTIVHCHEGLPFRIEERG